MCALLACSCAGDSGAGPDAACLTGTPDCDPSLIVVDDAWLASRLDTVHIVDVRAESDYDAWRIPGAIWVDIETLRTTIDGINGQVVGPGEAQEALRGAGVVGNTTAVVYSDGTEKTATRFLWTLEYYGDADIRLLDGGWTAWTRADRPEESGAPDPRTSNYTVRETVAERRVDADWILAHLDDASVEILDARADGEYVVGHIPGAVNIDWERTVTDPLRGQLLPRNQIEPIYAGIDRDTTVVVYCQTGTRSTVTYTVLRWLGYKDVRLFDGGWAEWESRDLPKEP